MPVTAAHDVRVFDSGEASLDQWLKTRALQNQHSGASRTYVLCEGNLVRGFYSLAASAVGVSMVPGRFRRNMPDPVPVAVLGRLAVDKALQGQGIGRLLVRDAALRVWQAAESIGIRGILVHAISDAAMSFYRSIGFVPSPLSATALVITLADLKNSL